MIEQLLGPTVAQSLIREESLGYGIIDRIVAYTFTARKQFAGRYFRGKIFSREEIFAGRYFRVNSIFAKMSSRENISNSLFAKISSRENNVLYSRPTTALIGHDSSV